MSSGRIGYVVATHPDDHSVDLVMADDGSRLVGVQVSTMNGSTRSGSVDLPAVPDKADKWDISKLTGQDMKALVDYYGRTPVVTGFLYPQINQILSKDPKLRYDRHQSDVISSIDGDGNIQVEHPCGAYVRFGETPDKVSLEGKNADANSKVDRNTGRKAFFRIGLGGNAVVVTMTPDGDVTMKLDKDFSVDATGNANIACKAATVTASESATIDSPETFVKGNLTVDGKLTYKGGMSGSGGGASAAVIDGNMQVNGNMSASGSITDGNGDGGA